MEVFVKPECFKFMEPNAVILSHMKADLCLSFCFYLAKILPLSFPCSLVSVGSPPMQSTLLLAQNIMGNKLKMLPILMKTALLEEIQTLNYRVLLF
jgi:hypothetical protein